MRCAVSAPPSAAGGRSAYPRHVALSPHPSIAARGVWELRLDDKTAPDLTYVSAHEDGLLHRVGGPPATLKRASDVARDLATQCSWQGSPDVRPREAPPAVSAPASLPWRRGIVPANATGALRRFQAALHSSTNDPRIVANGIWDAYFSELLRDHGAPTTHRLPSRTDPIPLHHATHI